MYVADLQISTSLWSVLYATQYLSVFHGNVRDAHHIHDMNL